MKKLLLAVVVLLAVQSFGNTALGQPDINNTPKAANPPNRAVRARPKPTLTEQMAKRRAKKIEARVADIRLQMTQAGFTDEALQTAVVNYYQSEQEARAKISNQYLKVVAAINDKTVTNAQLVPLLAELRTSVAAEKIREEQSFADFSAKLKLTENPRLDALLLTQGVTGTERALAAQASGVDNLVNALAETKTAKAK